MLDTSRSPFAEAHFAAAAREVADVTGAGDTVIAVARARPGRRRAARRRGAALQSRGRPGRRALRPRHRHDRRAHGGRRSAGTMMRARLLSPRESVVLGRGVRPGRGAHRRHAFLQHRSGFAALRVDLGPVVRGAGLALDRARVVGLLARDAHDGLVPRAPGGRVSRARRAQPAGHSRPSRRRTSRASARGSRRCC